MVLSFVSLGNASSGAYAMCVFEDNLQDDDVFALPTGSGVSEHIVFKSVAIKPGQRMYLQRACALSVDAPELDYLWSFSLA